MSQGQVYKGLFLIVQISELLALCQILLSGVFILKAAQGVGNRLLIQNVGENVLDAVEELGGAVDQVGDLLQRRLLTLNQRHHFHLTGGGDDQKADGIDGNAGSAAATKVVALRKLGGQVNSAGSKADRNLGDRDDCNAACGENLFAQNGVRVYDGANLIERIRDYILDRSFSFHD